MRSNWCTHNSNIIIIMLQSLRNLDLFCFLFTFNNFRRIKCAITSLNQLSMYTDRTAITRTERMLQRTTNNEIMDLNVCVFVYGLDICSRLNAVVLKPLPIHAQSIINSTSFPLIRALLWPLLNER